MLIYESASIQIKIMPLLSTYFQAFHTLPRLAIILFSVNLGIASFDLLPEDSKYVFISDDIFHGITGTINDCWNSVFAVLGIHKSGNNGDKTSIFWDDLLMNKIRPFHKAIRDIDAVILANRPSTVLNNAVNVSTLENAFKLSSEVNDSSNRSRTPDWLESIKDGWIKVAAMMAQLHFKYNWVFDDFYNHGLSEHTEEDISSINKTLKQYFTWYDVKDLNRTTDPKSSDEMVPTARQVSNGSQGVEKNLFAGLRELLQLEVKRLSQTTNVDKPDEFCMRGEAIAGKRDKGFRYIPVYVLLHLLNAEFKYYLMENIFAMHSCFRSLEDCRKDVAKSTATHLTVFYSFYYEGIVEAFNFTDKAAPSPASIPIQTWRWRCDPNKTFVEGVSFTRFFDFQTFFMAEEAKLSLTQTCRDSCDMIDGGFSSIPCEDSDWNCLGEEKDFDCYDYWNQGRPCPGSARQLCPNGGIKCSTSKLEQATVCKGQRDRRYLEWLGRGVGDTFGKQTPCAPTDIQNYTTRSRGERSGITRLEPENCEICLCKCYEPITAESHRYISLLPVVTDTSKQKAMVGIKFVKIGDVIYPKIAQASVDFEFPDSASVEWIEPQNASSSDLSQVFRLGRNSKNILLDDFLAPPGFAITGLRFATVEYNIRSDYELNSGSAFESWHYESVETELALEVQVTAISELGRLQENITHWLSNAANSSKFRTQIILDDPDEPNLSSLPSLIQSTSNQFISVQTTSIKKDVGQTPIPFFDTQELIESTNLTLLQGLGLFYKGRPGFGGFLSFRTISFPISELPHNQRYDLWHSKRIFPSKSA